MRARSGGEQQEQQQEEEQQVEQQVEQREKQRRRDEMPVATRESAMRRYAFAQGWRWFLAVLGRLAQNFFACGAPKKEGSLPAAQNRPP